MADDMHNPENPMKFGGTPPPQFYDALKAVREKDKQESEMAKLASQKDPFAETEVKAAPPREVRQAQPKPKPQPVQAPTDKIRTVGSHQLEQILAQLREQAYAYTEITLPSRGVFYSGEDGPQNGILHIRPMTGEDEQILATPKFARRGVGLNMIFQRCCKEVIKPDSLLSVDRTHLLIALRSISYGHEYEVEIKCPGCDKSFSTILRLDQLMVNFCPVDFGPPLLDTLPKSGFQFEWHLPRGYDESLVSDYREKNHKEFGTAGIDDSLLYRMSLMIDELEGIKDKIELMVLLKKLPIQDVAYLRTLASDPPFGVDTKCPVTCELCYHDFTVDLPLEASFFFPRLKRKKEMPSNSGDI
jgi:hypothetical protein